MNAIKMLIVLAASATVYGCGGSFSGSGNCSGGSSSGINCDVQGTYTVPFSSPDERALSVAVQNQVLSSFDAANLAIDTSSSSVQVTSGTGTAVAMVVFENNATSSHNFSWVRDGSLLLPSSPGAVNAWVAGLNGEIAAASIDILGIQTTQSIGNNTLIAEALYSAEPVGTATVFWTYEGGGTPCPDCVIK